MSGSFDWHARIAASNNRVLFAYDWSGYSVDHQQVVADILPYLAGVKVGIIAQTAEDFGGVTASWQVRNFVGRSNPSKLQMIDFKLHDVKDTVEPTMRQIAAMNPDIPGIRRIITAHGITRQETRVALCRAAGEHLPTFISVLTDHTPEDCMKVYSDDVAAKVFECAEGIVEAAREAGRTSVGLVCSPLELKYLHDPEFDMIVKIAPGVRPAWSETGGQKRFATPKDAIKDGADFVVIGGPIAKHENPAEAVRLINEEVLESLLLKAA